MDVQRFLRRIERAAQNQDSHQYRLLVEEMGLRRIDKDFFYETFSDPDAEWEIDWWIDYEGRPLYLSEIYMIPSMELFQRALASPRLIFDNVEEVIENLAPDPQPTTPVVRRDIALTPPNTGRQDRQKIRLILRDRRIPSELRQRLREEYLH